MSLSVSIVIAILVLCLASEVAPASPSSSLSRCPFTINSTNGTITINRTDELKRRDVTPEQFDEHLAALVWCLPKTYNMEKPPFVGEKYESLRSKGDFPTINCNSIYFTEAFLLYRAAPFNVPLRQNFTPLAFRL